MSIPNASETFSPATDTKCIGEGEAGSGATVAHNPASLGVSAAVSAMSLGSKTDVPADRDAYEC